VSSDSDIRLGKVLANKQKRLPTTRGERVRKAVPKIESSGVSPFPKLAIRRSRYLCLIFIHGDDLHA
jgi:hypothetical protein